MKVGWNASSNAQSTVLDLSVSSIKMMSAWLIIISAYVKSVVYGQI